MASALFAVWTAFSVRTESDAAEVDLMKVPSRFRKVMVLFSAETAKEDRDAFLAGLEEGRLHHQKDYHEIVRKWRESAPAEPKMDQEKPDKATGGSSLSEHDVEREIHHNPWFLDVVDTYMVSTEMEDPFFDIESNDSRLRDMNAIVRRTQWDEGYHALIVVSSDVLAAEAMRLIRRDVFGIPPKYGLVVLFAGVSSFDESIRNPLEGGTKAPYAFAIQHPVDPWPNTDLALSVFPKTKKVILLVPEKLWNAEKETAFKAKFGPGKTLKTILMPEIPKRDVTEADIAEIKRRFAASVKAEIQPDTVIVSMASVETGQDPASWLPDKFDACPVFSDTAPALPSTVGGFCRSMEDLGTQVADFLEQLAEVPLFENKLPPVVQENDRIWLNEAALKRYRLKLSDFPENAVMVNTNTNRAPRIRLYRTWSMKRILLLLAANVAVLSALGLFCLISIRAIRRKRQLSEAVYDSLPVRVLVTDREGRIIDYHMQFGEVEQKGEILWKNISEVPWLRDVSMDETVRETFDSGKTVVREFVIDGERRVVVLSPTPSDIFGRAAVIAVSSDLPGRQTPPLQ